LDGAVGGLIAGRGRSLPSPIALLTWLTWLDVNESIETDL